MSNKQWTELGEEVSGVSELPNGWSIASLTKICSRIVDGSHNPPSASDIGSPMLSAKNIQNRVISFDDFRTISHDDFVSEDKRTFINSGDVLLTIVGAIGRTAVVEDVAPKFTLQRSVAVLKPSEVNSKFLSYALESPLIQIFLQDNAKGTAQKGIYLKALGLLEVPLAPLPEQKRIADKLDATLARVDACRERLARVTPLLKRFRQSVLAAAYTGKLTVDFRASNLLTSVEEMLKRTPPVPRPNRFNSRSDALILGDYALAVGNPNSEVPTGWKWVSLIDIAKMESGHTPSRNHPEYWGGDVSWIGIVDARKFHAQTITDTLQKTNELGLKNSAARLLPKDTVCVSRTASVGYVVKMGSPMATSQDFVNWVCTDAINPDWLKWLFVAEGEALPKFGKGTTHTTIYFPEMLALHVALAPIEEQTEIVRRVETLFAFADRLEARLGSANAAANRLTPSLLAKAFRGELVPQDPSDEPASELLKRLAAQREATTRKPKAKKAAV